MGPAGAVVDWTFARAGAASPSGFRAPRRLLVDHGDLLVDAAVAGLGVCQVFDFMVAEPLRRGELVEVLRHQSAAGPGVHALCLPGRQGVPKIRAFLDFVGEVLRAGAPDR